MNQRASHGRKETQKNVDPNPRRIMKRIGFLYEFLNRPMHGGDTSTWSLKIFNQKWVDPDSQPALSGEHILLPIIYTL